MSTIAWDGKILASSRLAIGKGGLCEMRKVMRMGGSLYAGVGEADAIDQLFRWLIDGQVDFPKASAMLVEVKMFMPGHVFIHRADGKHQVEASMIAFGTGKDHAIKIMNQGANALDAIKYASVWDDLTAGGIDVVGWKWETTKPVDMPDLERLRVLE